MMKPSKRANSSPDPTIHSHKRPVGSTRPKTPVEEDSGFLFNPEDKIDLFPDQLSDLETIFPDLER